MSGNNGPPGRVVVGRINGPWGTEGVVRVQVFTDVPELLAPGVELFLEGKPVALEWVRWRRNDALVQFAGLTSHQETGRLVGAEITVSEAALQPLDEDSYYHYHLLGLHVVTQAGDELGQVVEIITTGSADVFVVRDSAGREVLLPAIADVVKEVDVKQGRMVVELLQGLR